MVANYLPIAADTWRLTSLGLGRFFPVKAERRNWLIPSGKQEIPSTLCEIVALTSGDKLRQLKFSSITI